MVEQERKKATTMNMTSKKLLLMNQLDQKSRIQLERNIKKKQDTHEKNLRKVEKERYDEISKIAEKHAAKKACCAQKSRMFFIELE